MANRVINGENKIYTVKLLKDNGEPDLNEKGNSKYQMVNETTYEDLASKGRVELVASGVANEGKIIRR